MKTKNKVIALVEIAVVLCSMFLVAIPVIAAGQNQEMQNANANTITTASEDNTLEIYGNANEDDTIDMRDLTYVKLIFFGKKPETELADAKYDGKINPLDFIQIKLIIVGKEKEITIVDGNGDPVTVHKPVERVIIEFYDTAELMKMLAKEKVVGFGSHCPSARWVMENFLGFSGLPCVGAPWKLDYEAVLNLHPDVLLTFGGKWTSEKREKLPGVAVVYLGLYTPDLSNPERSKFTNGVAKLGYILDREEKAYEYINWRIGWIDRIKSRIKELSEEEKPRVLTLSGMALRPESWTYKTKGKRDTVTQEVILAGGKSVTEDLPSYAYEAYNIEVDPEWVIKQNPDYIIVHVVLEQFAMGYGSDDPSEMAAFRESILSRPELANVNAVKTGNVYIMFSGFRNDATGGIVGASHLAKVFHPTLFPDLDPEAIHQEYLTRFLRLDYDLDEHGVFFYPPIIKGKGKLAGISDRYYDSIVAQP